MEIINIPSYAAVLEELKIKIRQAQQKAVLSVNKELIFLYWDIGVTILEQQHKQGWGAKIIDRLSQDLRKSFPTMKGVSTRNLKYMRKFAAAYRDLSIVQQLAAQIPWFHNCTLLDKVSDEKERIWYIFQTIKNGWSRNVLLHQIESKLFERQKKAKKVTNFRRTLVPPQSDLAQDAIKDPYVFDFLTIAQNARELELQNELVRHIAKFLLEL